MQIFSFVLLLVGAIFFAVGAVVFGLYLLEGIDMPLLALAGAATLIVFGVFCWQLARIESAKRSEWSFTRTGVFVHLIFVVSLGAAIIFSVLVFPNPKRGEIFLSLAATMILSMILAEKILARMGKPLIKKSKE